MRLRPLERTRPPLVDATGIFAGHTLPRGVAVWGDELFMADPPRHRILRWRPCYGPPAPIPTIGGRGAEPRQLDTLLGLAISHRDDLVVADSGNWRLALYTLPGLALRRILGPFRGRGVCPGTALPEEGSESLWRPVDVASGPDGSLYVADANGSIWRLDAQGRPDPCYPGRLPEGTVPRRVLVDRAHRAYVMVEGSDEVLLLDRYGQRMPRPTELGSAAGEWLDRYGLAPSAANLAQARAALLPEELSRRMDDWMRVRELDASVGEHQARAYRAVLPEFLRAVLPGSRLSLAGEHVLLAAEDAVACHRQPLETDLRVDEAGRLRLAEGTAGSATDGSQPDCPLTDGPPLLRRPPAAAFARDGLYRPKPLDSERVGNPWHRVVLEFSAPERTGVRLFTFTSDVPRSDLDVGGLLDEPPRPGVWQAAPDNAEEWLVQSQPGRYLYLALALKGTGDRTPSIERVYVYARRQSSLRYLPATYQADETSRHVLDRLLSLFDTVLGEIESEIEDFPLRLDLAGTPPDFLPWLASWFDLSLQQSWSDAQRRDMLAHVMQLYRWRGTIRGLRLLLQLHAGLHEPMPRIVEHYRGAGNAALETWLGTTPEGDPAHHFTVLLPAHTIDTADKRGMVQRLIDANKPAHTDYTLRPVLPGLRLGSDATCGTALGLDSLLGSHAAWRLPDEAEREGILGGRTVLPAPATPRVVAGRLGQTRLGGSPRGCRTCPACEEPSGRG